MGRRTGRLVALIVAVALAGSPAVVAAQHDMKHAQAKPAAQAKPPAQAPAAGAPKISKKSPAADYTPTVRFRLKTELAEGKMAFVGISGDIEGVVNPTLRVAEGAVVQVSLVNADGIEHDVIFPQFKAGTDRVNRKGAASVTVFRADKAGEFDYFCSLPGHQQAGMAGKIVGGAKAVAMSLPGAVSIARDPADLPGPLAPGAPRMVSVELEAVELLGKLANDTSYRYWTFNGKVPGRSCACARVTR